MATEEELARMAKKKRRRRKPQMKLVVDDEEEEKVEQTPVEYKHKVSSSGHFEFVGHSIGANGIVQYHVINDKSGIEANQKQEEEQEEKDQKVKYLKNKDILVLSPDGKISDDDFELVNKIGEGSQGTVDLVRYKKTGELLARKIMNLQKEGCSTPKQFIAEFQSLHSNDCVSVIKCKNCYFTKEENKVYMLLEYMDGGSLEDVIQTVGALPEQVIHKILIQLLNGLHYLHKAKQIVHRDIKPANILINSKGVVKFCDLAMAGHYTNKDVFTTVQGSRVYMSPERLMSLEHSYDSDIWSLGILLAELAIGDFPEDNLQHAMAQFDMNSMDVYKFPKINKNRFSPEFVDLIESCMRVKPSERPTAQSLFHSPFIKKYALTKPSLKRWVNKRYFPVRQSKK